MFNMASLVIVMAIEAISHLKVIRLRSLEPYILYNKQGKLLSLFVTLDRHHLVVEHLTKDLI